MKITIAQINTTVGDLVGNTNKIISIINDQKGKSDLVVFSELAICGYPPLDLIVRQGFYEEQMEQLGRIAKSSIGIASIVGYFRHNTESGKPFFNSLAFMHDGEVKWIHDKTTLPVYNIFDEARHFEPGKRVDVYEYMDVKFGLLICEEVWADKSMPEGSLYVNHPVKETIDAGADILISINASPSNVGKPQYRLEKFSKMMRGYGIPLIYVNQVGGNDDIVFDGTSFATDPTVGILHTLKSFEEDTFTFKAERYDGQLMFGFTDDIDIIKPKTKINMNPSEFYFKQIVLGIRDYVGKCGFKKAVVSSSGGVDSALVLALAVEALGKDNVVGITMPSEISSKGSVDDSQILCNNLGVTLYNYPIAKTLDTMLDAFRNKLTFIDNVKSITKENMQARIRGTVAMGFTNQFPEFLLLSCGNKSEAAVGYCTLYGDQNGGLAPISDLYKTEIWELCRYINKLHGSEIIPNVIIDKEPSAELYEGQKDTNSLPPYPVLDSVLIPYIEGSECDPNILEKCRKIVSDAGFTDFAKIHQMVDRSEFKRRQAAPTIRVHQKAWGSGRRMPLAQRHNPSNVLV